MEPEAGLCARYFNLSMSSTVLLFVPPLARGSRGSHYRQTFLAEEESHLHLEGVSRKEQTNMIIHASMRGLLLHPSLRLEPGTGSG